MIRPFERRAELIEEAFDFIKHRVVRRRAWGQSKTVPRRTIMAPYG
jgi:hypothetical protein